MPVLLLLLPLAVGCRDTRPLESQRIARPDIPASASSEEASIQSSSDGRPVIVAFGDSLTAGYGTEPGESYPDYLQKLLDEQNYRYRVVNLGVSGNTTKDGVERLKDVMALRPSLVIVEFGGNDGLRGLPITSTRTNLANIVDRLKRTGTQVVLAGITLPPNYGADYIDQFNKTYVVTAEKFRVPMIPFLLQGVYGVPGSMQNDQTHATAQGNEQVARNVLQLLAPLLKKSQAKTG